MRAAIGWIARAALCCAAPEAIAAQPGSAAQFPGADAPVVSLRDEAGAAERNDRALDAPTRSPVLRMREAWSPPRIVERLGRGLARYSLGSVEASWYRYGGMSGVSLQRDVYVQGPLRIDLGAAFLRLDANSMADPKWKARTMTFPMVSLGTHGRWRSSVVVAPGVAGSGPSVFLAQTAWDF